MAKIFISRRNVDPDLTLARESPAGLFEQGHSGGAMAITRPESRRTRR